MQLSRCPECAYSIFAFVQRAHAFDLESDRLLQRRANATRRGRASSLAQHAVGSLSGIQLDGLQQLLPLSMISFSCLRGHQYGVPRSCARIDDPARDRLSRIEPMNDNRTAADFVVRQHLRPIPDDPSTSAAARGLRLARYDFFLLDDDFPLADDFRLAGDLRFDEAFLLAAGFLLDVAFFLLDDDFFGTLPPAFLASDNPIAIACLRLLTFFPERPLLSVPALRSCIAFLTLLCAFLPYLAMSYLLRRLFLHRYFCRRARTLRGSMHTNVRRPAAAARQS
jgi:hypothetical protein